MPPFSRNADIARRAISNGLINLDFCLSKDHYFSALVELVGPRLKANVASAWDNNFFERSLVHQASCPRDSHDPGRLTIRSYHARVGYAIGSCNVYADMNASEGGGQRVFLSDPGLRNFAPSKMVSIPVPATCDYQWINVVIGLSYNDAEWAEFYGKSTPSNIEKTFGWMPYEFGRSLANFINRISSNIRREVENLVLMSHDLRSLFHLVGDAICARGVAIDRLSLLSTHGESPLIDIYQSNPRRQLTPYNHGGVKNLIDECRSRKDIVTKSALIIWRAPNGRVARNYQLQCNRAIIPITSQVNPRLEQGYLLAECSEHTYDPYSLGAIDLHILSCYARNLAACWERYERGNSLISSIAVISKEGFESRSTASQLEKEATSAADFVVISSWRQACKTLSEALFCKQGLFRLESPSGEPIVEDTEGNSALFPLSEEEYGAIRKNGYYVSQPSDESSTIGWLGLRVSKADQGTHGAILVSRPQTSGQHPEPYFTNMDITVGKTIVEYLGLATSLFRVEGKKLSEFQSVARALIDIAGCDHEPTVYDKVLDALKAIGYKDALLTLFDETGSSVREYRTLGSKWSLFTQQSMVSNAPEKFFSASQLKMIKEGFIVDTREHALHIENRSGDPAVVSQFFVPIRIKEEFIGTLQIDLGEKARISWEEELNLTSFGYHMAVVVSRIRRGLAKGIQETERIMASSRFIAAEALSGLAVHQFSRRLRLMLDEIEGALNKKGSNEHPRNFLVRWKSSLNNVQDDLGKALDFFKGGHSEESIDVKLQDGMQAVIDVWIPYIRAHRCKISLTLEAKRDRCHVSEYIFREILSVLIVNAVQAQAKNIKIISFNAKHPELAIDHFCVDIIDDGYGISEEMRTAIFQPGFTTKKGVYGTGLGLFIARRLANNGGGDVCLKESELGERLNFSCEVSSCQLAMVNVRNLRPPRYALIRNHLHGG